MREEAGSYARRLARISKKGNQDCQDEFGDSKVERERSGAGPTAEEAGMKTEEAKNEARGWSG